MKWFDANIGSVDCSFQERTKILQAIRVDRAVNVRFGMVDHFVRVFVESIVRLQRIGVQFCTRSNIIANLAVKVMLAACTYNGCVNLSSLAVEKSEHNGLTLWPATVNLFCPLVRMHVACLAADKGFVGFDRASHLVDGSVVLSVPNAVKHEPR